MVTMLLMVCRAWGSILTRLDRLFYKGEPYFIKGSGSRYIVEGPACIPPRMDLLGGKVNQGKPAQMPDPPLFL